MIEIRDDESGSERVPEGVNLGKLLKYSKVLVQIAEELDELGGLDAGAEEDLPEIEFRRAGREYELSSTIRRLK